MNQEKSAWSASTTDTQQSEILRVLASELPAENQLDHYSRDRIYRMNIAGQDLAIKKYRLFSFWKSFSYRHFRTPAERSFCAAKYLMEHHIGTAEPVGFLEYWAQNRVQNSYYICAFQNEYEHFGNLFSANTDQPETQKKLVQLVAQAISKMHTAHFLHRDLGNQNIFLPKNKNDWKIENVKFFDLNRARIVKKASVFQRALDLARIDLPAGFQKFFIETYVPPSSSAALFAKLVRMYRCRFMLHGHTKDWRHPKRLWARWFGRV